MYGQGNYAQLHHGPPSTVPPPPPFQQAPPSHGVPRPQMLQSSLPPYQHGPPAPPQAAHVPPISPLNMGQPYAHRPPPLYAPPGASYPAPIFGHNVQQPLPPPPRVFPPPPPPAHSQGQHLYRIPPPLPPGIQHLPASPLPPPMSSFIPVSLAQFTSFRTTSGGEAQHPSLPPPPPPPPPPPSSPPPLPPPPPVASPLGDHPVDSDANLGPVVDVKSTMEQVVADTIVEPDSAFNNMNLCRTATVNEVVGAEKEVSSRKSPLQPPKPTEERVIHNIEVLCQYIAKMGPEFENVVRAKEAKNPQFAFLHGGDPGTSAALAHEYFQWMKEKHRLQVGSCNEPAQEFASLEPSKLECPSETANYDAAPNSPASSDMDMDDDKDSSYMEDVSPIRPSSGAVECCRDDTVVDSGVPNKEYSSGVNVSSAISVNKSMEISSVFVKDGSPFRLIQGYASDESGEDSKKDSIDAISPVAASVSVAVGLPSSQKNDKLQIPTSLSPKNDLNNEVELRHQIHSNQHILNETGYCCNSSLEISASASDTFLSADKHSLDDKAGNIGPSQNNATAGDDIDVNQSLKLQAKDSKQIPSKPNVDEFGRLLREGISDSDSDDLQYNERHSKRGRSWSRSQSPQERSRNSQRSYNPRSKRSRSRSLSPRRSRSRSPRASRRNNRGGRRDRDRPPECFNFVRGRCFRGASCRFLHRDFGQGRNNQHHHQSSRKDSSHHDAHDPALYPERSRRATKVDSDENKSLLEEEKLQSLPELSEAGEKVANEIVAEKISYHSETEDVLPRVKPEKEHSMDQSLKDSNNAMKEMINLPEVSNSSKGFEERTSYEYTHSQPGKSLTTETTLTGNSIQLNETVLPHSNLEGQRIESAISQNQVLASQQKSNQASSALAYQSQTPEGNSQLQPYKPQRHPTFTVPSNDVSASLSPRQPTENSLPPLLTYQSLPQSDIPPQQPSIASDYQSQNVHPINTTWSNAMPAHFNELPGRPFFPSIGYPHMHSEQNTFASRNDFAQPQLRPYQPMEHVRSHAVDFRPQLLYPVDSSRQPALHMDHLPMGTHIQSPLHKEIRLPLPGPGPISFPHGSIARPHFSREQISSSQSFAGDNVPPRFPSMEEFPSVKDLPFSSHQPSYAQQFPPSSSFPSALGGPNMVHHSIAKFPPERNLPPQTDIAVSKTSISMHYNPFASTFEQGTSSSKFGSSFSARGIDIDYKTKYDSSFGLSQGTVGVPGSRVFSSGSYFEGTGEHVLSNISNYAHGTSEVPPKLQEQSLEKSEAGAPYDPLFDSIEPSSDTLKKLVNIQGQSLPSTDVESISRFSNFTKPANAEHKSMLQGDLAPEHKSEVEDLGEVATDAEVGVVENESPQLVDGKEWSPGFPVDLGNSGAGEIEIDQARSPGAGKNKKKKDSRSMKLFKVTIAEFVKEVLKPSWRQGNMSKEAFKTIVKKTVDKVSGAMSSHQIPKSQAKINQYVESSQRKLTKLVMGYVDKYVKM